VLACSSPTVPGRTTSDPDSNEPAVEAPEGPHAEPEEDEANEGCAPQRTVLRRLNRLEYDRSVQDLLHTDARPSERFPDDDIAFGFDTVAEGLSLSPLLLEQMEAAASELSRAAVVSRPVQPSLRVFEAEEQTGTSGRAADGVWFLEPEGELPFTLEVDHGGRYALTVFAFGWLTEGAPPTLEVELDDEVILTAAVEGGVDASGAYEVEVSLAAGRHRLGVRYRDETGEGNRFRALAVDWLRVEGPFGADPEPGPAYDDLVPCDPHAAGRSACAAEAFAAFARRAWRRPVSAREVDELVQLSSAVERDGGTFEAQVALGLQAILISPHFIFRFIEGVDGDDGEVRLSDHELATRLSYFLWRTTPDEQLLRLADDGRLSDPAELERQVDRLLDDPRARAMVTDFFGQWLHVRGLSASNPDPTRFPEWSDALRSSMIAESESFAEAILRENRTLFEIIDSDFTFVDDRLAGHYGLPAPNSETAVRVSVPAHIARGGVLFQGSFLTVTSDPRRTNPVRRGSIILESLLCSAPPPPPPGVEGLPEPVNPTASLRDRFEQHRSRPECETCHQFIDPLGFSLENFDAIGRWRATDAGFPIDASGELVDGTRFVGPEGLATVLRDDPRFGACVIEKLAVYALGRALRAEDECRLRDLRAEVEREGLTLRSLVRSLATSELFTTTTREPE